MEKISEEKESVEDKMSKTIDEIEEEKERKLVNLIVEIIVKATLKEYYETCDQIPEV